MARPHVYGLLVASMLLPACSESPPDTGGTEAALGSDKVTICHVPPGNPANAHEITVGTSAANAHLGHGDQLGLCGPVCAIEGASCLKGDDCCLGSCPGGRCRAVSIRGVAWYDASFDGLRGSGESLLPGVTFHLHAAATGASIDTAITDLDGSYSFYSLAPGSYFIEVDPGLIWGPTPIVNANDNLHDDIDSDFALDTRTSPTFTYTGASISGVDCGLVGGI